MAKRLTIDVLAERMKNYHVSNEKFQKDFEEKIVPEIQANTKLRHQFKGVVGVVAFVSVALGTFIMWVTDKVISVFKGSQ
jgi:hypothetical protein